MGRFRAGFLAAAVAATAAVSSGSLRAEEPGQAADQAQAPNPAQDALCPGHPDVLGTSRVLPIDFSAYQQLGRMQYPDTLPLNDKEVVITFDDGPLPPHTDQILDILAAQCVKATFFMVGEMARAFPATVRRVYEDGHTIGTHSDHHPTGFGRLPLERMQGEIDGGLADVAAAFGSDPRYMAPFFRIPGLDRSDLLESELGERGLIIFSADVVADDWHHGITPNQITALALKRLEAHGSGILLLHDIHPKTVAALPGLLNELKAHGFHVVQVVPSAAYEIAMARKPAIRMLASALPGELSIGHSIDGTARPAWPHAADEAAPEDTVLPVPAAAAFEPDAVVDGGQPQWPQSSITAAAPEPQPAARHAQRHGRKFAAHENRDREIARTDHREQTRRRLRTRAHARGGGDGNHADLVLKLKALAAVFSPTQSAR